MYTSIFVVTSIGAVRVFWVFFLHFGEAYLWLYSTIYRFWWRNAFFKTFNLRGIKSALSLHRTCRSHQLKFTTPSVSQNLRTDIKSQRKMWWIYVCQFSSDSETKNNFSICIKNWSSKMNKKYFIHIFSSLATISNLKLEIAWTPLRK